MKPFVLDLVAVVGSTTAALVVLFRGRAHMAANLFRFLVVLLVFWVGHDLANLVEWSGVSALPDTAEDYLEGMWALLWPLALVAFLNEKNDRDIRESEERYRNLVERSHSGISVAQDGRFVFVSRRMAEIMGHTVEEMTGRSPVDFLHPDDVGIMERNMVSRPMGGPADERYTVRVIRTDGSVRYLDIIGSVVHWQGSPASLGNVVDVTERRLVEEALHSSLAEKETLLREIHHRVKNNLQAISGLLNLQAYYIRDSAIREVCRESQNRIITMALIHEKLYQSGDLARIDFGDYLRQLGKSLLASYGVQEGRISLELDADHVSMVVDTAIPCGLIVNELVTNSIQHAFQGRDRGRIRVGLHRMDSYGMYELTAGDDGVGFPQGMDLGKISTMGLRLVRVLVEQLGGTLDLGNDGGVSCRIRFSEYHEAGTEFA